MNQLGTPQSEKETQIQQNLPCNQQKALREKHSKKELEPKLLSTIKNIITLMEAHHILIIGLFDQQ